MSKGDPNYGPAGEPKGPQGKSEYYGGGQKVEEREEKQLKKGDPMFSPARDGKGGGGPTDYYGGGQKIEEDNR